MPKYTSEQRIKAFWDRVDRSNGNNACWNWNGATQSDGYGTCGWENGTQLTHRIAYSITYGEIPKGLYVLHSCDTPACCNPLHLRVGTQKENMEDRALRNRDADRRGEKHGRHKLSDAQIIELRERFNNGGVSRRKLAREYEVGASYVGKIISFKNRTHPISKVEIE